MLKTPTLSSIFFPSFRWTSTQETQGRRRIPRQLRLSTWIWYQFEFTSLCTTLLLSKGQGVLFQLPLSARNTVDYCLIFLIFFELRHGQMLNKRQSTLRMAVKWSVLLLSTSSLELGAYNIVILSSGMRRGIPGRCLLCNWEFGTDPSVGGRSCL